MGPDGLRSIRSSCTACAHVRDCLKAGVESPAGIEMRAARMAEVEAVSGGGLAGFFRRWSELKAMRTRAVQRGQVQHPGNKSEIG